MTVPCPFNHEVNGRLMVQERDMGAPQVDRPGGPVLSVRRRRLFRPRHPPGHRPQQCHRLDEASSKN
jgi:hypothetical protein